MRRRSEGERATRGKADSPIPHLTVHVHFLRLGLLLLHLPPSPTPSIAPSFQSLSWFLSCVAPRSPSFVTRTFSLSNTSIPQLTLRAGPQVAGQPLRSFSPTYMIEMRPNPHELPSSIVHSLQAPTSATRVESIRSYKHQAPPLQPSHLHCLSHNHHHERASILPRNMHTGVTGKCVKGPDLQASRLKRPPSLANPRAIQH